MSTDVIAPPTQSQPKSTKSDKPKQKKKKEAPVATAVGSSVQSSRDNNKPAAQFKYVFGVQEKALHDWMSCVFDPDKFQAPVPNATGGFELYTQLWRTRNSGSAVAAADGTAVVACAASGWTEDGNTDGQPRADVACMGFTTPGRATLASDGSASVAIVPYTGVNPATNGLAGQTLVKPTELNGQSRIRLVGMKLEVHSVMAQNTSKGEVLLCGSVNPAGGVEGGTINGSTWDNIMDTNDDVMVKAIRGLPGWKPEEKFSIVAIPAEQQAFEMQTLNATGYGLTNTPLFSIAALARGLTPGDSISYNVTYVWETEMSKSYEAVQQDRPVVPVDQATLDIAKTKMRPYATLSGTQGIHALPWVETLATTSPAAIHALASHPSMRPVGHVLPSATTAFVPHPADAAPTSFLGKLYNAGQSLLGKVVSSGVLSKIPYVGGILNTVANGIKSIFS